MSATEWKAEPCTPSEWRKRWLAAGGPKGLGFSPAVGNIAAWLMSYATHTTGADVRPTVASLITLTGLTERPVREHLGTLQRNGWVIQLANGRNFGRQAKASTYQLSYPAEVTTP